MKDILEAKRRRQQEQLEAIEADSHRSRSGTARLQSLRLWAIIAPTIIAHNPLAAGPGGR